jgi:hypothetical protein
VILAGRLERRGATDRALRQITTDLCKRLFHLQYKLFTVLTVGKIGL